MIQQDEHILYINQAKCAVTIRQTESMKTGMLEKKIVITTRRCLFFESLSNQVLEIEFEVMTKKKRQQQEKQKQLEKQRKKRISINQFPEHSFPINDRECKVMIDEEPSCHKYLQKIGLRNFIKSISGIVILKNIPKMKFELLAFPTLKDGFRFCKALICAQAWTVYETYCNQNKIAINKMWIRILCDIANNQKSTTLIDPDLFLTGTRQQIKSFLALIDQIPFAHTFQHRYSITNNQIAEYTVNFMEMFQQRTNSLIFNHNSLNFMYLNSIFNPRLKLQFLLHLDLSHNVLTDQIFATLQRLAKDCKKLSTYCLHHNQITFNNPTLFINFLKATQVMLSIDLCYNQIGDDCVDTIEKFVIMPANPPVEEINLSWNKISKKGAWRLFVGNNRYNKYHTYLNFVIYPVPIQPDTFPDNPIEYPKPTPLMNFNMHSALVQQFEQQSFMKHTLNMFLPSDSPALRLIRRLPSYVKLPRTKQEVLKSTQMANRLQNFIYSPQFVQNMYDIAEDINKFEFNIPPVSKARFIKYLSDKLNQALFIRDHYSVKFILKAFRIMQVDFTGYMPRINKLNTRNDIIAKKIENITNFEVDEYDINRELDEIVREGLRVYLTGNGIEAVYYLKYLRDKWIQRLIQQKFNPENFIHKKMAAKNMNFDDQVTEKQLVIPYQIRVEKKINENFYLHPWRVNYLVLSQILKVEFDECLQFLEQSSKKQKFAIYFELIQERIQFIRNQFSLFNYSKFKITYNDLKINCARLLSMYNFITEKNYYLEIPSIARKNQITKEKIVTVPNQARIREQYHISKYFNINQKSRRNGFYNYTHKFTKYGSQIFFQEYLRLKGLMDAMFRTLQTQIKANNIPQQIIAKVIEIIKYIRQSIYPQQLKQQFYLRILSWRKGRHSNNIQIMRYMPFITMYLRPPLPIEKYLIAAILSCETLNIGEMPLCIVSDVNKSTDINIQELDNSYVERDWMGSEKLLTQLMSQNGKIHIQIQLLVKNKIDQNPRQSQTVGQIVSNLQSLVKDVQDITHFWLYLGNVGETGNLIVLEESQHIGELLCEKEQKQKYFLFKRRIYCPQWKYIYKKYSEAVINNLFYDWRYQYLLGQFFINHNQLITIAARLFLIDAMEQTTSKTNLNDFLAQRVKNLGSVYKSYMPPQAVLKLFKNSSELIALLRDKITQKIMKKEHLKPLQIKKEILQQFEDYPQFFCSNYLFMDRNKKLIKMSINWLQIYVNAEEGIECFGLERIISVIPKAKYLLINYHKHEGIINKVNLFGDENKILSTAQDILAYCMIRVRMLSPSLYAAFRYEFLSTQHVRVKVPTKDQEIIENVRRLKKKLESANPTIIEGDLIPYFKQNKFIKVSTTRKLYANASGQKLDLIEDQGGEVPIENFGTKKARFDDSNDLTGHNAFKVLFPNLYPSKDSKNIDDDEINNLSSFGRSFSEPPELSAYNNISMSFNQDPDMESATAIKPTNNNIPPEQQSKNSVPKNDDYKSIDMGPPELTPIKNTNKPPQQDQFQPITTAQKARSRLPPKKNR